MAPAVGPRLGRDHQAQRFGVTSLGTTIIYDRAGRIVERLTDAGTAQLEEAFAEAGATMRRTSVPGAR